LFFSISVLSLAVMIVHVKFGTQHRGKNFIL